MWPARRDADAHHRRHSDLDGDGAASSTQVDGGLISWVPSGDESAPLEVRVWTWQLDGTLLVATEAEQIHCFRPGQQYPRSC